MKPQEVASELNGGPLESVNRELSRDSSNHVESTQRGARIELGPESDIYNQVSEVYNKLDNQIDGSEDYDEIMDSFGKGTGMMIGAVLEQSGQYVAENYRGGSLETTFDGDKIEEEKIIDNSALSDFNPKLPALHAKLIFEDLERITSGDTAYRGKLDKEDPIGGEAFTSGISDGLSIYLDNKL